jgi:hypothetical protein
MKKLKLDLDEIQVRSFDVAGVKGRAGTVHAHTYTIQSGQECEPTGLQYTCYSHDGRVCVIMPFSYSCDGPV